jgi:hypothetical protein
MINNDGILRDALNLGAMTAASQVQMNIGPNGIWLTQGAAIAFGAGNDVLSTEAGSGATLGGIIYTGRRTSTTDVDPTHVIDFGAGADNVFNGGFFVVNPSPNNAINGNPITVLPQFEAETRLIDLEVFTNSGVILLGGIDDGENEGGSGQAATGQGRGLRSDDVATTDGWYDDILSMPDTRFIGDGGEIVFDIDLTRSQSDCTTRNSDGDLGAADCLMLHGGSTEGLTYVTLKEIIPGDRGGYNPDGILLVDVTGGGSAQGHFVVGPNTPGYSPLFGGILDKGVLFYGIAYNEDTQGHVLVGLPSGSALQFTALAGTAQDLWRTSTGAWFDRQADLRGELTDGIGGGVWLRTSAEFADRDLTQSVDGGGQAWAFDNAHKQASYAVTGGLDVMSGSQGDTAYVVGLMAGYAHADVEYATSPNAPRFDGFTGGGYASFVSGGLFIDAAVNANRLELENDIPSLQLFPAGSILATRLVSVGAQIEAGWRFPTMQAAFVEPLAAVSYVRTKYEAMDIPSDDAARPRIGIEFDDPTSLRGSLGARAGMEQDYGVVRAQYSVLGRVWNEFEGENGVVLHSAGPDALLIDDRSGAVNELGLGASVYSGGGLVSGFINLGGKFGEDYEARTASAGVRVAW